MGDNKYMKSILKYIFTFFSLIFMYFLVLLIVSLIPSSKIKENVSESADYLLECGQKEEVDMKFKKVYLFHYTNALMINTAYSIDSAHPVESLLTARKNYIPGITKKIYEKTPKDLQSASKYYDENVDRGASFQTQELWDTVNENDLDESFEYARYWHGYLTYLRPLLLIFNYYQISIFIVILFLILVTINAYLLFKKIGIKSMIALIFSYICTDVFIAATSLNEITCFIVAEIASIYILAQNGNIKNIGILFFIIGSVTNFVDFLTNPIITYGFPVLTYFLVFQKNNEYSLKEIILIYVKTSILWFIGYAMTWFSKWLITDLILNREIISNAFEQIKYRTDINQEGYDYLILRLKTFLSVPIIRTIEVIFAIWFIKNLKNVKYTYKSISYTIGIFIPLVWYAVLLEHSYVHTFFTYRNLSVAIFALQLLMISLERNNRGLFLAKFFGIKKD